MSQRKWLTEADEYVCTLSEETQQISKEELREDKHTRDQALTCVRDWIKNNPRILNCRLDAKFLLRFLRAKKFSVVQAQECLERYLLLRQSFGVAFSSLDIRIPMMEELTDMGVVFACPKRDRHGRRVLIARGGLFDLYRFTQADMLRIGGIVFETLMEDEENQVRGFVYLGDGQGVGLQYLGLFTPKEAVRLVKNGEKTLPARHKEVHGININSSLKFLVDFGMSLISEKYRKRVNLYTSIDDMITSGKIDLNVLPKEYGGVMPISEMTALWKEELKAANKLLLSHDQMLVNENMFSQKAREGAVSALKRTTAGSCGSEDYDALQGVIGNFRKLEVD